MKKILCYMLFFAAAVPSFAESIPKRSIFIEGAAFRPEHRAYFMANFRREIIGTGISVENNINDAGYIFRFFVEPNIVFYTDGSQRPAPPGESQNVIRVGLFKYSDGLEMVTLTFYFSELHEMDKYNQFIVTTVLGHIPPLTESGSGLRRWMRNLFRRN